MELSLEDHFGVGRSPGEFAGQVVVLVYAGRRGAPAALRVGRFLHERFAGRGDDPSVTVIPVACLAEVPRLFHGVARGLLRRESPEVVVWIDFRGTLERTLGLRQDQANVAILDPRGRLEGVHAGDFTTAFLETVAAEVERCRRGTGITPCPPASG